jgi:hypothetical protein
MYYITDTPAIGRLLGAALDRGQVRNVGALAGGDGHRSREGGLLLVVVVGLLEVATRRWLEKERVQQGPNQVSML